MVTQNANARDTSMGNGLNEHSWLIKLIYTIHSLIRSKSYKKDESLLGTNSNSIKLKSLKRWRGIYEELRREKKGYNENIMYKILEG